MAKNSKKKKKNSKKRVFFSRKIISIVLLAFLASFAVVYAVNYFEIFHTQKKIQKNTQKSDEESTNILMEKMKKMLDEEKSRIEKLPKAKTHKVSPQFPPVVTQKKKRVTKQQKEIEKQNDFSEIKDYKNSLKKEKKPPLHVKKEEYRGKPKLAIVLDDVAFAHQTKIIKKIPFKISPSFFPPTKRHPDTVKLSKDFRFKMVHLPMEALSYGRAEPKTLLVGDSIVTIRARIKQIKKWFPDVKYYNNHTGSKFTSNYQAMDRFMKVMREENLHFVDSRTTAKTKAPEIAKKYKMHLYSRDVFLDNSTKKELIKEQLKKAVKIAKKRGYAVAIGHPHESTLQVLIHAKHILKGVELVYLKEL